MKKHRGLGTQSDCKLIFLTELKIYPTKTSFFICLSLCQQHGSLNLSTSSFFLVPSFLYTISLNKIDHTVCYYHVTYTFRSESTRCVCLNVKELLAQSRCDIWSLSDRNGIITHNHLVRKQTLNHLAKVATCLTVCLQTMCLWVWIPLLSLKIHYAE